MDDDAWLSHRFDAQRGRLRAVAYRMLGSHSEADDAVQETWLRLHRSDREAIENMSGWLTTVIARVCLDMLRARRSRRESALDVHVPDPIVSDMEEGDPEGQAVLSDSVGLALLVVLETLTPAERLAFVLHDVFAVPFDEIAPIVERSPAATRQLASRARRRVRGADERSDRDPARQRAVVEAFLAASRDGDIEALLTLLDPDVVLRLDRGRGPASGSMEMRGAPAVAGLGFRFSGDGWSSRQVLVNGGAGLIVSHGARPFAIVGLTIRDGQIAAIDMLADQVRIRGLELPPAQD